MWDAEAGSSSEDSSGDEDEDMARREERIARRVREADVKKDEGQGEWDQEGVEEEKEGGD